MIGTEHFDATVPDPAVTDLADDMKVALARLTRRVRAERTDTRLSDTANSVLTVLVKLGPQTLGALSERERVTPPAMNQTVNTLEAAGYVIRQPDPTDGRKVLVVPTENGIELTRETRRARHVWLAARIEHLSDDERQALAVAARVMKEMADS